MSSTKEKVGKLDLNLRHESGVTSEEFISKYCEVFSKYAFATRDGSLNEFEKEITHVLGMYIYYRRFCEILGFADINEFDPREYVWKFDDAQKSEQDAKIERAKRLLADAGIGA